MIGYIVFCIVFISIVWFLSEIGKQGNYSNCKYLKLNKDRLRVKEFITYEEYKEIRINCEVVDPVKLIQWKGKYYWKYVLKNQNFDMLELEERGINKC